MGTVAKVTGDPTLRDVLARVLPTLSMPYEGIYGGRPDYTEAVNDAMADPALAAAERVLAAAVEWERGRLDDTEAFVSLVEAVHAYRSVVEGR